MTPTYQYGVVNEDTYTERGNTLRGRRVSHEQRWDDTGSKSIDTSCQKYHSTVMHHCLKVFEA